MYNSDILFDLISCETSEIFLLFIDYTLMVLHFMYQVSLISNIVVILKIFGKNFQILVPLKID